MAYQCFQEVDVLDISQEGENNLQRAKQQYDLKIESIEKGITQVLIDKLGKA